jgi:DNA-binding transcriptional regulator YdaS (Cro superfamily)
MDEKISPVEALERAVSVAGSQMAFARICGVGQPAVSKWLQLGRSLPAQHVLPVESKTGVRRHLLRPDLYPTSSADLPGDVAPGAAAVAPNRTEFSVERKRA